MKACKHCLESFAPTRPTQVFCKKSCKNTYGVAQARRRRKQEAVAHLGGKCERCGFDEHPAALTFHHADPNEKEFQISSGNTYAWEKLLPELEKCHLLCANCHAIVHSTNDPEWVRPSDRTLWAGVPDC